MKIIISILFLTCSLTAQQVYELTPGTKGNEITITLANNSTLYKAENVNVKLIKESSSLKFKSNCQDINMLDIQKEADLSFEFDVERSANVNTKDTIEFLISNQNGKGARINVTKRFIFSYTAPKEFKLEQNFPNPFNPATTIQYQLPFDSKVNLRVYDILGKEAAVLTDELVPAGFREVIFDGERFASGLYVYKLTAVSRNGTFVSTKKMMMIK